jgi:hypothetical protein
MERVAIYVKDLQILTGKSERYCRYLIKDIREATHKQPHQLLTLTDCRKYLGIPKEELINIRIKK